MEPTILAVVLDSSVLVAAGRANGHEANLALHPSPREPPTFKREPVHGEFPILMQTILVQTP